MTASDLNPRGVEHVEIPHQVGCRLRPPTPRLALSIPEFCEAHGISEGFYYKLKKQGQGPREMKVGARTLITFESAAEWRRARENQPAEAP